MVTNVETDQDIINGACRTIVDIILHPDKTYSKEEQDMVLKNVPLYLLVKLDSTCKPHHYTLGSSFHRFPQPLGIFIVHVTMYLTDPLFRQALQPIPLTVVRQSVSPLSGLLGGNTELSINLRLLLAVIRRVHGAVATHRRKDSINLRLLLAIVRRVYGVVNTHRRGGF